MSMTWQVVLACLGLSACAATAWAQAGPPLQTRAEHTGFEETSSYAEVRSFMEALAAGTRRARVESFGRSEEGRDLPLLVLGDPPAPGPMEARQSERPIVFVMANIHAGEVEGKEALLHLARRLTSGDLQPLLNGAVWLFAPIYNADGNEKVDLDNRSEQHGPIGGVGTRENAKGLDLNRDFMKLDSAEARALVALLTRWDPHVVVDLHTTNGSFHGYHLTYSPTLNPNADGRLIAYARERLLPTVREAVAARHGFRTYYYGNFDDDGPRSWRTFDHRPRFGNNYVGLRNRVAILSEAYSYLDFARRVKVTEAFVEEIMRYVTAHASEIRALVSRLDAGWTTRASAREAGVRFEIRPLPEPVDILVGAVEKKVNQRSGRAMEAMLEDRVAPVRMLDYGLFAATVTRRIPPAYLVLPAADGVHPPVAALLKRHGVRIDELRAPVSLKIERFVINEVRRAERSFQGHRETSVLGRFEEATVAAPAGALVVRTDQPLGPLVFYLLEPESDDGVTTWNMMDAALTPGAAHPVLKILPGQPLDARPQP
jgi:Zinc carboxypeptidase